MTLTQLEDISKLVGASRQVACDQAYLTQPQVGQFRNPQTPRNFGWRFSTNAKAASL